MRSFDKLRASVRGVFPWVVVGFSFVVVWFGGSWGVHRRRASGQWWNVRFGAVGASFHRVGHRLGRALVSRYSRQELAGAGRPSLRRDCRPSVLRLPSAHRHRLPVATGKPVVVSWPGNRRSVGTDAPLAGSALRFCAPRDR